MNPEILEVFAKRILHYREKAREKRMPYERKGEYVARQQWYWQRAITNEEYIINAANYLMRIAKISHQ
jgi:hypothetical protein